MKIISRSQFWCCTFLFIFLIFISISQIQAQTKGYMKMGKFTPKQLNGLWIAPPNLKLLGNGKEILLKKLSVNLDEFSIALSMDYQEIINNKPSANTESEQAYNISLVNDVFIIMLNKNDKESVFTPYIFVVKKVDAQNLILATEKEDFVFKKSK